MQKEVDNSYDHIYYVLDRTKQCLSDYISSGNSKYMENIKSYLAVADIYIEKIIKK